MEIILISICVCLFIFLLIVILYFLHIKREIRRFSNEVEKLKDKEYAQPLKLTCFDKDITELAVKINEHIDIQRNLSVSYEDEKNRLNNIIAGISHDFRTPLTSTNGYLQMIEKSRKLDGTEKEYLEIAIHKTEYMKLLSDDFFEITALETNRTDITREDVNICTVLTECLLGQYDKINELNLDTDFNIPETPIIIETNRHILTRIFENLISNAVKYAEKSIKAELTSEKDIVIIRFSNDIADKNSIDISKVFEPFYRGKSRTKSGSGIGLYVVKSLGERIGFNICAEFDKSQNFVITLKYENLRHNQI